MMLMGENMSHCHSMCYKLYVDCPGIDAGLARWLEVAW